MKKLILLLLLPTIALAQLQPHWNEREYFNISMSIDPNASIQEKSLDANLELEYVGKLYVKVGIEYFPGLSPSYFDWHGAIGVNVMQGLNDEWRAYSGIRLGRIFRESKSRGELFGLETGLDYKINDSFFIGIRGTYDYRNDGIFLGWDDYWRASGFVRVGIIF